MFGAQRRGRNSVNIWPGFVDALATILLAFVFVLMLFVVSQFYLSDVLSGRNRALLRLETQVDELANALSLERKTRTRLEEQVSRLYSDLHATLSERDQLRQSLRLTQDQARELRSELTAAEEEIAASRDRLKLKLREVASLQADIASLRELREKLEAQIGDLASALGESRQQLAMARDRSKALRAELADAEERTRLAQQEIEQREVRIQDLVAQIDEQDAALAEEKELTADTQAKVETLRRQLRALQQQIASLAQALSTSRETVSSQRERIDDLGERLNVALAEKVQELSGYRSEFFGRLREVLGDIEDIRVVGDRFMFQSELFFDSAAANIGDPGKQKLDRLAETLKEVAARIPDDIEWVLEVQGHTDRRPISTPRFPSNWELSTARATNIVHYLIDRGVAPERLAAAGFGEYQPIADANTPEAYSRNRRIELRLTNR